MDKIDKSLMPKSKQDQPGKPPAAKPLHSRWIPEYDPTPRVNVNYRKVPRQFLINNERSFCIFVKYFIPARNS